MITVFDRKATPNNLLTILEWRRFAREAFKINSWENAARRYADTCGGALVMLADDTLVVFTKRDTGKISRRSYKPGAWKWA